jgi:cyanoexosortase A
MCIRSRPVPRMNKIEADPHPDIEQAVPTRVWRRPSPDRAPAGSDPVSRFSLGWMGLLLVAGHLILVARHQSAAQLGITFICWYAVGLLTWKGWRQLKLSSSIPATFLGLLLLGIAWSNALWMNEAREKFLFVYPLIGGLGWALLASGFVQLQQYWRQLIILFLLGVPRGFVSDWIDLSPMTAHVAAFLLWYAGRDVQLIGTEIVMPGGAVTVDKGCDGTGVISYLVCLGVVFVFLFRLRGARRVLALVAAPLLAFLTNMMRVIALALMEAAGRHDAFEYWHDGSGSMVWTVLPVLLFGCLGLLILPKNTPTSGDPSPSNHRVDQKLA